MRILIKKNSLIFVFLFLSNLLFSQGLVENELTTNQMLVSKYNELKLRSLVKSPSISDTLSLGALGILDDFSYEGPYPDTSLWMDNFVFINRGFAKSPITIGAATFDGLTYTGMPYDFTATATSSAAADYLTSKPINLSFLPSDSVYFSFYYQPQGNGNAPEYSDSLVLQFKAPGITNSFQNVWAKKGSTLATNDSSWTLVMIPITNSLFLQKGFQFRFKNYATLSGNTDHWNIDYVYLNKLRSKADTSFNDVSFVYNGTSLLKNYRQMPWEQFNSSDLTDTINNYLRYNKSGTTSFINISYGHEIWNDFTSSLLDTYSSVGSFNLLSFETTHTYSACDIPAGCRSGAKIDTTVFPTNLTGPSRFTIKHYIGGVNLNPENDTLRVTHEFFNSYAYDDGTAENSFGLSTLHAQMAEKFTTNQPDSLQYIDIFFNPFLTNTSIYSFYLKVWSDGGGVPGSPIYTSSEALSPVYGGIVYNQFIRYKLDAPLYLTPGSYYFGFEQNTTEFLNIGVDKNSNTQDKIFYNVTGTWYSSPFVGSLMLHPVLGYQWEFTGVHDIAAAKLNSLTIYPNPSTDEIFIKSADGNLSEKTSYTLIDMLGRTIVESTPYHHSIVISDLKEGVYFIQITEGSVLSTHKFIKTK